MALAVQDEALRLEACCTKALCGWGGVARTSLDLPRVATLQG